MSKHTGISYFVCPMDAPGVTIRPIIEMTGGHTFNEVFLDDVRLPVANLVGDVGQGWSLAKVTLANERVSLSSGGALWGQGPTAGDLMDVVRAQGGTTDPALRDRLARLHIEGEVLRLIRLRTVTAAVHGREPGPEASVRKVLADEHGQHVFGLAKDLAGAAGMLSDAGPLGAPADMWGHGFLFAPALTVGGGTGEVQRNIIGERVLGLPHEPDVESGVTWAESRRVPDALTDSRPRHAVWQDHPMAKRAAPHEFRRNEKVRTLDTLRGVPAGTEGRVYLVDGFAWTRYRVLFANGEDVGSLDGTALARPKDFEAALERREQAAEVAEAVADDSAAEDGAAAGGGGGDKTVNGVVVPALLLDRSKRARERLTAA